MLARDALNTPATSGGAAPHPVFGSTQASASRRDDGALEGTVARCYVSNRAGLNYAVKT
jgi:hypothetical protein